MADRAIILLQIPLLQLYFSSTHLCQPLDLVFFNSVKQKMKKRSEIWHGKHVGQKMGKYVMIKECAYPAFEVQCKFRGLWFMQRS